MGLFDSIIGTTAANSETPAPFVLDAEQHEEFVAFEPIGGGGGGTGTGSGTGNGDGSGGGSGNGSGQGSGTSGSGTGGGGGSSWGFDGDRTEVNPDAFAHIKEPKLIKTVEGPAEMNIDIGGNMSDLISGVTLGADTSSSSDSSIIIESTPEPEIVISGSEPLNEGIMVGSLLDSVDVITPVAENIDLPITSSAIMATLEDRISGFVSDLEALKADDEMLLHEKEAAIAKLEGEMKDLEKEVKKIQADETKIDLTIASLNNTPKTK